MLTDIQLPRTSHLSKQEKVEDRKSTIQLEPKNTYQTHGSGVDDDDIVNPVIRITPFVSSSTNQQRK